MFLFSFLLFGLDDAAAVALIVGAISAVSQFVSQSDTNATNQKIAKENRDWNEQMQDKENQYNLPENQMKRLKDAGINPTSTIMGQGTSVAGNTSAPVNPSQIIGVTDPMSAVGSTLSSVMSGISQGANATETYSLLAARKAQIQAETENLKKNAVKLGIDADGQRIINKYADELNKWAVADKQADVAVKRSVRNLNVLQARQIKQDLSMYRIKVSQALKEYELTESEIQNNYLNLDWIASKILSEKASARKIESDIQVNQAQIENLEANTFKTEVDIEQASKSLKFILDEYEATIAKIKSDTAWTDEQVYWYTFDQADKHEVKFMGIPIGVGQSYRKLNRGKFINEKMKNQYENY